MLKSLKMNQWAPTPTLLHKPPNQEKSPKNQSFTKLWNQVMKSIRKAWENKGHQRLKEGKHKAYLEENVWRRKSWEERTLLARNLKNGIKEKLRWWEELLMDWNQRKCWEDGLQEMRATSWELEIAWVSRVDGECRVNESEEGKRGMNHLSLMGCGSQWSLGWNSPLRVSNENVDEDKIARWNIYFPKSIFLSNSGTVKFWVQV